MVLKQEISDKFIGVAVSHHAGSACTAGIWYGEGEVCGTDIEAFNLAEQIKMLIEAKAAGHTCKIVINAPDTPPSANYPPGFRPASAPQRNPLFTDKEVAEALKADPVTRILSGNISDEISRQMQWRIDRRKALLEVAPQILTMYRSDLPNLVALSGPGNSDYMRYAVRAAAILIDEIEAKVNMDEKIKTGAK